MAHKNRTNISPYKTRQAERGQASFRGAKTAEAQVSGSRHKKPSHIYALEEASDRLRDLFANHEMGHITHVQRNQLAQFYRLLMLNQEKENFTRLLKLPEIGMKHFVDCLIVDKLTKLRFPLLDMGTGPGFPGIPLKILHPEQKIILAEGVQRRVEFLKHARQELKLQNLDIIGRNVNPWFMYPVNGVITRAVEDVRNTLLNVLSCLQLGGRVYLMKGPGVDPELEIAQKEVSDYYRLVQNHPYFLPKTAHERRLVVFEKIKIAPLPDIDDEPWPEDE